MNNNHQKRGKQIFNSFILGKPYVEPYNICYIYKYRKEVKTFEKDKEEPKKPRRRRKGDMGIIISSLGRVFLLLFLLAWVTEGLTQPKFFNVMDYGAVGGGKTDNSKVIYIYTYKAS